MPDINADDLTPIEDASVQEPMRPAARAGGGGAGRGTEGDGFREYYGPQSSQIPPLVVGGQGQKDGRVREAVIAAVCFISLIAVILVTGWIHNASIAG